MDRVGLHKKQRYSAAAGSSPIPARNFGIDLVVHCRLFSTAPAPPNFRIFRGRTHTKQKGARQTEPADRPYPAFPRRNCACHRAKNSARTRSAGHRQIQPRQTLAGTSHGHHAWLRESVAVGGHKGENRVIMLALRHFSYSYCRIRPKRPNAARRLGQVQGCCVGRRRISVQTVSKIRDRQGRCCEYGATGSDGFAGG